MNSAAMFAPETSAKVKVNNNPSTDGAPNNKNVADSNASIVPAGEGNKICTSVTSTTPFPSLVAIMTCYIVERNS